MKPREANLDAETLRSLMSYDPETGVLTWKERDSSYHQSEHWNRTYAGTVAFSPNKAGYLLGNILGGKYYAHRVAWAIYHGEWPTSDVDHINGDRADNGIENIRVVSRSVNQQNCRLGTRNKSGVTGVGWSARAGKWKARIGAGGRDVHLGFFDTLEEAAAARKAANVRYGFHENHGRAA